MKINEDGSYQVNPEDPADVGEILQVMSKKLVELSEAQFMFATILGLVTGAAAQAQSAREVCRMLEVSIDQARAQGLSMDMLDALRAGMRVGLEPSPDSGGGGKVADSCALEKRLRTDVALSAHA